MTKSETIDYESDEAYCTEFTNDVETGDFGFICPSCGETNPLGGEPTDFFNKPFRCIGCNWVSLLRGDSLEEFEA